MNFIQGLDRWLNIVCPELRNTSPEAALAQKND